MRSTLAASPGEILRLVSRALGGRREPESRWRRLLGRAPSSDTTIIVAVEEPRHGETVVDFLTVRGWAKSFLDEPVFVELYINGAKFGEVPSQNDSEVQRFELILPWSQLGAGSNEAQILLHIQHGPEELLVGPLTVTHSESPLLRHSRGAFTESWGAARDDAGPEELDARLAREIADAVCQLLEIQPGDRVLEVACGRGEIGAHVARCCDQWTGVEFSGSALSHAIQHLKHLPNIRLEQLGGLELEQFPAQSFERVYCSSLLMYLDEWERWRLINEVWRLLAPGGSCYFDTLNLCGELGWEQFVEDARLDPAKRSPCIQKPSAPEELKTYLQRAGFERIRIYPGELKVAVTASKARN